MILILADECVLYFRKYRKKFEQQGWHLLCVGDENAPAVGDSDEEVYRQCAIIDAILITANAKDFRALERIHRKNIAIFGIKQFMNEQEAVQAIDYVLSTVKLENCRGQYISLAQALNQLGRQKT